MRHPPPEDLVSLLENLHLATSGQVAAVERRARRLARGLPLFTSVWVDALVGARVLTPFQAAAVNAQRGEQLRIGPHVLRRKLAAMGYADVYEARHADSAVSCRLAVFSPSPETADDVAARLEQLVADSAALPRDVLAPVESWGRDGERFWAACDARPGRTAGDWMIYHGRLPAEAVGQIARAMLPGLVSLEKAGLCHGDIRPDTLLLGDARTARSFAPCLPFPGLRAAVRPCEGYAHADLAPEAFDGLAPERVRDGTPPDARGDVFACGCLWWHLLTGRDPLPGGDALTKLQAAEAAAVADLKPLAPDAPSDLVSAIRACTQAAADARPQTMARLASMLGPDTKQTHRSPRAMLARSLRRAPHRLAAQPAKYWLAGAAAALCLLLIASILLIRSPDNSSVTANQPGATAGFQRAQSSCSSNNANVSPNQGAAAGLPSGAATSSKNANPRPPAPIVQPQPSHHPSHLVLQANDRPGDPPIARLPLAAGQRVHGPPGRRITLNVARQGLSVDVPGVVFEDIDFVWPHEAVAPGTAPAILVLRASGTSLRNCTFRTADRSVDAVRWIHPADPARAAMSLPSGHLLVERCIFANVATAVDCHTRGALAVRLSNVLHHGDGALVRLARRPNSDEPIMLSLERTTLRESGPLVECGLAPAGPVGKITIETNGCVLSPRVGSPLVMLLGDGSPGAVLDSLTWAGQGSLVAPDSPIAGHQKASGQVEILPEDTLAIDGLVRGKVEFAGLSGGAAADSQAVQWIAPLSTDQAPGIDAAALPR